MLVNVGLRRTMGILGDAFSKYAKWYQAYSGIDKSEVVQKAQIGIVLITGVRVQI